MGRRIAGKYACDGHLRWCNNDVDLFSSPLMRYRQALQALRKLREVRDPPADENSDRSVRGCESRVPRHTETPGRRQSWFATPSMTFSLAVVFVRLLQAQASLWQILQEVST